MATYFVSQTGSNTSPWDTVAKGKTTIALGVALLSGGDTLMINDGTYNEWLDFTTALIPGGSSGAPTIIKAINSQQVTVVAPSAVTFGNAVINLGQSYITVDGLVTDATECRENGGFYIVPQGATDVTHITIKDCIIKNNNGTYSDPNSTPCGILIHGLLVSGTVTSHLFQNNDIFTTKGHGIYVGSSGNTIEGNRIYGWVSQLDISAYGIQVYSGVGAVNNNIIRNNTIHNYQLGIILASGTGNLAYNNVIYSIQYQGYQVRYGATANAIYNNTIYGCGTGSIVIYSDATGTVVRNNILYSNGTDTPSDSGISSTINTNLIGTNPLFADAPAGDFHLLTGSPAIDSGAADLSSVFTMDADGQTRPVGTGWDYGAYEFGSTGPPSGSNRHLIANDAGGGGVLAALGGNWQQLNPVESTIYRTAAGYFAASTPGAIVADVGAARWIAHSFGADQYSTLTFVSGTDTVDGDSNIGVCARASGDVNGAHDFYFLIVVKQGGGTYTSLYKIVNGAQTFLGERSDVIWAAGDRIEIECEGPIIRAMKSGGVLFTATDSDSALIGGAPGIVGNGTLNSLGDNWEGGNLNDSTPSVPAHKGRRLVFMKVGR